MAAALLRRIVGSRVYVDSAGVSPQQVDPFMVTVMAEIGIDLSDHASKSMSEAADGYYDLILSLSPEAQHQAVEMTRLMACDVEYWPTLDPSLIEGSRETRLDAFRALRQELDAKLRARFGDLNE